MTDLSLKEPSSKPGYTIMDGVAFYEAGKFETAHDVFHNCAEAGDATAWFWLSTMHMNGDGIAVDKQTGFNCCLKAAEMGSIQAQTNLGVMYIQGDGVAEDIEAGLKWLCCAADAGDTGAQFNAATIMSAGKIVEKDLETAVKYYQMAADSGYHPAQARLGFSFRNGFGVPKDRHKAFMWLTLAAQHGAGSAISMLEGLVTEMTPDELHTGHQMVEKWMADHRSGSGDLYFRVDTN